jgi:hypothetical protein
MAVTEDDAGLVHELRGLLAQHGAAWLVRDVDAERQPTDSVGADPTFEAEALLIAISRTLGLVPQMLLDANGTLRDFPDQVDRVLLGTNEIPVADTDELSLMAEDALILRAPVADVLRESQEDDDGPEQ